ncbi:MAG: diiron oxygenase, partial [Rhodococcus sp. (in: high G+C Gram-positive bacteria)]
MTHPSGDDSHAPFPRATAVGGGPVRRRRSIKDRQNASRRLLFEAVDDVFDADLDIDWDHPAAEGLAWMPDHLCSLYGTDLWNAMPTAQRRALVTAECAEILVHAVRLDSIAAMTAFKTIARDRDLSDDRARYLLRAVNDLSRNVSMYSRILALIGAETVVHRRRSPMPAKLALLAPRKSIAFSLLLFDGGFLRSFVGDGDGEFQPHLRHLLEIHRGASNRVMRFAREELAENGLTSATGVNSVRYIAHSTALAWMIASTGDRLICDSAYVAAGLDPIPCRAEASRPDVKGPRVRRLLAAVLDACDDDGLLNCAPARRV